MNESERRRFRILVAVAWLVILAAYGGVAYLMVAFAGGSAVVAVFVFAYAALVVTVAFWLAPKILRRLRLTR